jgi:internalin A
MPEYLNEEKFENIMSNDIYLVTADDYDETWFRLYSPLDIHKLANIKNETTLSIIFRRNEFPMITDLKFIEEFPKLKQLHSLYIFGHYIENIESLSILDNLEHLYIECDKLVDLSPISNLYDLRYLEILRCPNLVNISPVGNLINLEHLSITCRNIINLSSIGNLQNLKSLVLSYNDVSAISTLDPIFDLYNIESLELYNFYNDSMDLSKIKKLSKLENFIIRFLNQANLNNLVGLNQLKELSIETHDINDVTPLLKLPNLEKIDLGNIFVDIISLADSNSLKEIRMNFGPEKWYNFQDNEGKIFEEKGIYVIPYDWR